MTFSFDYPWLALAALGTGVALFALLGRAASRREARLARFAPAGALVRLLAGPGVGAGRKHWPLRCAVATALALAAWAGPRWGTPAGGRLAEGIDVVYAVDASLSMLATDESPSRLERAIQEARRLRALSAGDRVGLIAFAGRSYILTPLTADDGAIALFLDNLDPSIVGQPGSSLAAALRQGADLLGPALGADRALVVFTDGETFDDRDAVLAAARRVGAAGISLVLVGFGTADGGTIPIQVTDAAVAPKRDSDGSIVITRHDPSMLSAAAAMAGGTAIEASVTDKAARVRAALSGLQTQRRDVETRRMVAARFQWLLAASFLLVGWEAVGRVPLRRRRLLASATALAAVAAPIVALAQSSRLRERAEAQIRAQRPLAAARAWKAAIDAGDRDPATLYNLGTAYLMADSLDAAIEILERAVSAPDVSSRADALFNLGLAYLRRGLAATPDAAGTSFRSAMRAYRSLLLATPGDADARWNYELAMRRQQASASSSGGGGSRGGGGDGQPQEDARGGQLSRNQASQLLDAAARDERHVLARRQRADRGPAVRGPDW